MAPATMKAVQITGSAAAHQVTFNESLPRPEPKGAEVLIKVYAAGITADEATWPELYETTSRIPGHDISGVIAALGPDYDGSLSVGDQVYAMLGAARGQGQAEYTVALAGEVALKPTTLSHAEAAALPIPALTALEAILIKAKIKHGAKVLVTGASGAVGVMLVQLASKLLKCNVIALASPRNHEYLRQLGASKVVDYNATGWEHSIHAVDAVFDTVGGDVLAKTWSTVESNGAIITVGDPAPAWAFGMGQPEELKDHPNVRWGHFIVSPHSDTLVKVAELIDEGTITALKIKAFPAKNAAEAWEFGGQRGKSGKAVLEFV